MAKNITLLGASYPAVPAVVLPQTGGGNATFVDPVELIDDNAGAGVTDKTWSADKLVEEFADTEMSAELTTAAPIQSFPDGAPYPMSLQFAIETVQAGSGDPSPSNIRSISGWTGANISVSPTQDAQDATVYPITFPSAAGTVYRGNVKVDPDGTGELVVDHKAIELGSQLLSWTYISQSAVFFADVPSDFPSPKPGGHYGISTIYKAFVGSYTNLLNEDYKFQISNSNSSSSKKLTLRDSRYTDTTTLINNVGNELIVYPLDSQETYQLTPGQVKSILGRNNVWADTGDIKALSYVRKTVPEMIRQDTEGQIKSTLELTIAELWNI